MVQSAVGVNRRNARTLVAALIGMTGCGHACPVTGPVETSWAEQIACRQGQAIADYHAGWLRWLLGRRVGCYQVRLGPDYLPNYTASRDRMFLPNPSIIELTREGHSDGVYWGFRVRTHPRSAPWKDGGLWRPTTDEGAVINLGNSFFGMTLAMHPEGSGLVGRAAMHYDIKVGDPGTAHAELWPTQCANESATSVRRRAGAGPSGRSASPARCSGGGDRRGSSSRRGPAADPGSSRRR
jgi:hypothetical protein